MTGFFIEPTSRFSRELRKLLKRHRDLVFAYEKILAALVADPYNLGRVYDILKLTNVELGDGQYRIRIQRWRFRYDVIGRKVLLQHCSLRREDTYA